MLGQDLVGDPERLVLASGQSGDDRQEETVVRFGWIVAAGRRRRLGRRLDVAPALQQPGEGRLNEIVVWRCGQGRAQDFDRFGVPGAEDVGFGQERPHPRVETGPEVWSQALEHLGPSPLAPELQPLLDQVIGGGGVRVRQGNLRWTRPRRAGWLRS